MTPKRAEKLKAELLDLRMRHPELFAEFRAARAALWQAEERINHIKIELALHSWDAAQSSSEDK